MAESQQGGRGREPLDVFTDFMSALNPFMSLLGGDQQQTQEQSFQPTDVLNMSRIGREGRTEAGLAGLQQGLFGMAAGNLLQGGMPGSLNLSALSSGRLAPQNSRRLDQAAFGGLNEGLRRAGAIAEERAGARGIGLSSIQGVQEAELQRPLIQQAAGFRANLEQAELGRLSGLRQNLLGNLMQLQDSPALNRLLQGRMSEQNQLQMSRFPGGLPDFTREMFGGDALGPTRKENLLGELEGLKKQLAGKNSWKGQHRIYQAMREWKKKWEEEFPDEDIPDLTGE